MYNLVAKITISIHALRVEGDDTHFLRGDGFVLISIHALRVEGDMLWYQVTLFSFNFYPRPPGGGRL